jgi:tRNA1Val (adenine37-N6)-methyltransferase
MKCWFSQPKAKRMNILRMKNEDETLDSFYAGRIHVLQKKKGYRFSLDAPLLADFIQPESQDELLELGAGSGIISLLLSVKPFSHITAIELQPTLADLARRNVRLNHLEHRITVEEVDLKSFSPGGKFDKIYSNPPYYKRGGGHISPSRERAIARHELTCDIFDIMKITEDCLKPGGRAYFIYPCRQENYFMEALRSHRFRIRCRRNVIARPGSEPNLFLCEVDFTQSGEKRLPPLILYQKEGEYTQEAEEIFKGRHHAEDCP